MKNKKKEKQTNNKQIAKKAKKVWAGRYRKISREIREIFKQLEASSF